MFKLLWIVKTDKVLMDFKLRTINSRCIVCNNTVIKNCTTMEAIFVTLIV